MNLHGFKCDTASETSLTSHSSSKLVVGGGGCLKPPPPLLPPPLPPPPPSVLFIQSGWLEPDDVIDPQLLLPLAKRSRGGSWGGGGDTGNAGNGRWAGGVSRAEPELLVSDCCCCCCCCFWWWWCWACRCWGKGGRTGVAPVNEEPDPRCDLNQS